MRNTNTDKQLAVALRTVLAWAEQVEDLLTSADVSYATTPQFKVMEAAVTGMLEDLEEPECEGRCKGCGQLPRYSNDGDGESGPMPGGYLYHECECEECC